ncbi:hypothetical protein WMY93_007470 [Mugilogobius chulae]|uniref:Myb-like domain-containing protein n=1 Tax=Mugilogobius chulae TaxID=88201 RepID=A0AAW0PNR4_9GOBI
METGTVPRGKASFSSADRAAHGVTGRSRGGAIPNLSAFKSACASSNSPRMAEFPGKERSERFKPEETKLLVELVRSKENAIYGDSKTGPKPNDAKQAWEEIAACISSSSGVVRSAFQCRKRYNDVRRRGKDKAATFRREMAGTGGGPSTVEPLTPAEELAVSTLPSESIEGFGGIEKGLAGQLAPRLWRDERCHQPGPQSITIIPNSHPSKGGSPWKTAGMAELARMNES